MMMMIMMMMMMIFQGSFGLATSHAALWGSSLLDFHHWGHSLSRRSQWCSGSHSFFATSWCCKHYHLQYHWHMNWLLHLTDISHKQRLTQQISSMGDMVAASYFNLNLCCQSSWFTNFPIHCRAFRRSLLESAKTILSYNGRHEVKAGQVCRPSHGYNRGQPLIHWYWVCLGPDNLSSFPSAAFEFNCVITLGKGYVHIVCPSSPS